ncbi:MAG TPA: ATP-grasp domain-containing protein [Methylophilaceae bacterium]|nr:ATP-grasp domain-containing protein [Methylophilaceae bacterium]
MRELIIIAHVPTDAINEGFMPAAKALGLSIILLTDCAQTHREHFVQAGLVAYPDEIIACDVFNPMAIIDAISSRAQHPAAIFSNSDHLQSSTALAAQYFGLPGKNWQTTYRAKNKAEMRKHLASIGIDILWHTVVSNAEELGQYAQAMPLPCIVKPREGVASMHVSLARDYDELSAQCASIWAEYPGQALLLEEYIEGPLYTLETLGDGKDIAVLGGFQVKLSQPPHFVELDAIWGTGLPPQSEARVLQMIREFGIGFGACHTEFVMSENGPRLIEINYRNIGDYREFLLRDTLQIPLFETVLQLYLGESLPAFDIPGNAAWIRYFTASETGQLQHAPAAFAVAEEALKLSYTPLRQVGDIIRLTNSNKDYLGVLRGSGTCAQRLAAAIADASQKLAWEIAA